MTFSVGGDEYLADTEWRPREPAIERPRWLPAFLTTGETWITVALTLVAFMAVVFSIESANWVSEMPSLVVAGLVGLLAGWLLAQAPLPALPLHLAGLATGLAVAVGQTMHTMRLEDPLLQSGVRARWGELWLRVGDWLRALVEGGISSDSLPFVLMLVFAVWALSYLASWSIFRWRNAWVALIPGGFALLTNISYLPGQPSQEFIIFLFAAILLVARLHYLRALREWRRERTWQTPYLSFEVLAFATWVGLTLILFAWLVPTANNWGPLADAWSDALSPVSERVDRLGRLFIGVGAKRDRHLHSFGDTLPLQGKVSLNRETVLLRVVAPELPNDRPLYLRGAVYDEYTAQGWKISAAATQPLLGTSVDAALFGTPETRAQLRRPVAVTVTVERSIASRRLFTVGDPITSDVAAELLTDGSGVDAVGLVPQSRVRDGDRYTTVGAISGASLERLLASGRDYPTAIGERYLQLPADLPPEVAALAAQVAAGIDQPYIVAGRIEAFLRAQYPFDLTVEGKPARSDGVAYFLFDARRGYFDHHASAMAVMLRTLGIPTRVAVGFALDPADFDSASKAYEVTEASAWTWPEVYFAGLGWVEFNPTPAQPLIARPGDDLALLAAAGLAEVLDETDLEELFFLEFETILDAGAEGGAGLGGVDASMLARVAARVLTIGSAVAVLLLAVFAAVRGLWAYRFRGLDADTGRWAKLQDLGKWAGLPVRVNRTALENAEQLSLLVGDDIDVAPLVRAFSRERYGAGAHEPDEEEAERLSQGYVAARNRLLWRTAARWLRLGRAPSAGREPAPGGV